MNYQNSTKDLDSLLSFGPNDNDDTMSLLSFSENPKKPKKNNFQDKPKPPKQHEPLQQILPDNSLYTFGDNNKGHEEITYIGSTQNYPSNNAMPSDILAGQEKKKRPARGGQRKKKDHAGRDGTYTKIKKPNQENQHPRNHHKTHYDHNSQHPYGKRGSKKDFKQGDQNKNNHYNAGQRYQNKKNGYYGDQKKNYYGGNNYNNHQGQKNNCFHHKPQEELKTEERKQIHDHGKTKEEIRAEREKVRAEKGLTIYHKREEIMEQVRNNRFTIVVGDTGCGKSTQLPQYLYEYYEDNEGEQILWVLPRKLPTLSLSQRVCDEMKIELGHEIGYEVPGKSKTSRNTLLKFVTDSVLINELIKKRSEVGPQGKIQLKYSIIILDEVHERNLYTDILLATLKEIAQNSDLKLLITSATINEAVFENYFQTKAIQVKGRPFPVEIDYNPMPYDSNHVLHMAETICGVVTEMEAPGYQYRGHILTFTAGVDHILKVKTKLEEMFWERWINAQKYEILPLHGLLAPDEQQAIFQETGKIKIILSTRMAETALTINGVRVVIDIGFDKETSYNAIKRMTVVEDKPIPQSSAIQRAGRAGRTSQGRCIRLYSQEEFEAFSRNKVSEIQRMNLGKLVLKLKALGIQNLKKFEFVEKPNDEVLIQTIEHLMEIGALDNDTEALTYIGKAMLKLETDPDFSKVIIEAWGRKCVQEVIEIIAMIGVNPRLYKRGSDDDTMEAADKKKLGFCHEKGDLLTLLKIYRFWIEMSKAERMKWCSNNYFSFHALNQAYKTTKELSRGFENVAYILKNNSVKKVTKEEHTDDAILKCFLAAFYPNVCLYTNVPMIGYSLLRDNLTLRIHGGSSLALAQDYPKYVFCIDINKTTFNNSKLVSVIQQDWLSEIFPGFEENPRLKFLTKTFSFIHFNIPRLSRLLLVDFKFKKIEEIKEMADSIETVFHPEEKQEMLKVYSSLQDQAEVERRFQKVIEKVKDQHRSQTRETPIVLKTRCIFHKGGEVREILLSHETLSIKFENFDAYYTDKRLEKMLSRAGEVVKMETETDNASNLGRGVITMKSYKDVNQVIDFYQGSKLTQFGSYRSNLTPIFEPFFFKLSSLAKRALRLRIEWFAGVSQCSAPLRFVSGEHAEGFLNRIEELKPMLGGKVLLVDNGAMIRYNGRMINRLAGRLRIRRSKDDRQLIINDLDKNIDEIDIENFMRVWKLDKGLIRAGNFRNMIYDDLDHITPQESVEIIRRELEDALDIENDQIFRIEPYIPKPRPIKPGEAADKGEDMRRRVEVDVFDIEIARKIIKYFDGKENFSRLARGRMHCSLSFSRRFALMESRYKVVDKELDQKLDDLRDQYGGAVRFIHEKGGNNYFDKFLPKSANTEKENAVRVITLDPLTLDACCNAINPIVSGVPFYLKTLSQFRKAEVKSTAHDIANLERNFKVSIEFDKIRKVYKIFGAHEDRVEALEKLGALFDANKSKSLYKAMVSFRFRPVRHVLQDNAALLVQIERDCGVNIKYSLMFKEITISGPQERVLKAEVEVTRQVNLHENKGMITEDECPICFEEFKEGYRLLLCGHKFCFSCLERELAERLASNPVFPLKCAQCVSEKDGEVICLRDLQNLFTAGTIQTLWDRSLDAYLRKNPNMYFRCFSPDCPQLFREGPEKCFSCDYCLKDYCKKCRGDAHGNSDCDNLVRKELLEKLRKEGKDIRECPGCKYIIERSEGCNKMECVLCRTIFCWLCCEIFSIEGQVYTHLNQVHPGH